MTTALLLESLSDDELIAETKRLVTAERAATAALLRSLMEIDTRRLYLREGCSSLFTYCTHVLHLAEVSVAQPAPQPPAPAPVARPNVDAKPIASRTGDLSVLSVDYYKLQVTISQSTHEKLRRAQDLLRHTNPTGDLATLLDRAVTLLLADFERRRCAATPAPRAPATEGGTGRHIPATVKREVWQRDQGRCAFIGTSGRCRETAFVEFHHVEPFAEGGLATVENIQLRCKAHNLYEASLFFGDGADCVRDRAMRFESVIADDSFQDES